MKLRFVILIYLICSIFTISAGYLLFHNWNQERIAANKTVDQKEQELLRQVSQKVGRNFPDWQSLREYVWCELLHPGMTRAEILDALEPIGEIRNKARFDREINFSDQYLNYYLAPIIMEFDSYSSDAKLVKWRGSPEQHFSAPKSSCEPDLSDYE